MRGKAWRNRGQALVATVLAVALAGTAWETLAVVWAASEARLEVQNSLEAGATAGAAVVADALNLLAVTNDLLLGLGVAALLGYGEAARAAKRLQDFQDDLIRRTPALAKQTALTTAFATGAHWVQLSAKDRGDWPRLMVRRVYLLPWLFGRRFPLWIADDLEHVDQRRWGDRVVFLEGVRVASRGTLRFPLRGRVGAAASCEGGGRSSWPLLFPGYDTRLIPVAGPRR